MINKQPKIATKLYLLLLLIGMVSSGPLFAQQNIPPRPTFPYALPFHLLDLDDKFHHLSDYKGKILVVNFWATWCPPCRKEIPSMNRAWAQLKNENIEMLAINVGEDKEAVAAFTKDHPIDFQVLLDSRGTVSQRWQILGMPTTIIVDTRGFIAHRIVGDREWDSPELLAQIRSLKPDHLANGSRSY